MSQSTQFKNDISIETNRLSKEILDTCFYIHTKLGPGLLESVYQNTLYYFLTKKGLFVEKEKQLPIQIDDLTIKSGLRLDLVIEKQIILELKSVEKLLPIHQAQLYSYLKLSDFPLGLLINFNETSLKNGIKRIAMTQ